GPIELTVQPGVLQDGRIPDVHMTVDEACSVVLVCGSGGHAHSTGQRVDGRTLALVHRSTAPAGASATRRRPVRCDRTCGPSGVGQLPVRWLATIAYSSTA